MHINFISLDQSYFEQVERKRRAHFWAMHSNRAFLSAIKPLFIFTNCFCLSFFSLKDDGIIVSKSKVLSSIFIFILCMILKCLRMFWYHYPGYESIIINLTTWMFMAFCLVSFSNYLARGRCIAKLWNDILPLANFINDDAFYRKTYRVVCLQLIGFNVAYVTFLIFYYHFFSMGLKEITFYFGVFADYCILMHFCIMGAFFSGGLYFGTKLISVANGDLTKLKKIEYYRNCKVWEGLEFVKINKMKNLRAQLKMIKHEDLSPLVDIYEKLCECFENLNECFGISVTASSLKNLMEMTLSCYFMTKHGWSAARVFSFWFLYCFVTEWAVLHACEKFTKEAQKSRHLIDRIVNDSSSQVLKDAVQRFSLHLFHRQMKFTACRLFDLDYQLLYSVMTNIITYLVIVLQFDNSKRDN